MHKDTAIKLQNVSKVYHLYDNPVDRLKEALHPFKKKYHKDFFALKNIDLEIKKGEVLGIVGVNGAGKSTLLKIIAGVVNPTTGRVNVHGKLNAILELSSGLKPEMTGVANIKLNLRINGIDENIEELTKEIIEFADIGEHIHQPVKTYSSGMKARLGFAIATSTDPDILIVDEVLAVGDVLFQRKCYNRIEKLFKDGKTVIFVSHSTQSVIEFCSRAVLLYNREIIMDDTPKKVTDYYQKLLFSKDKSDILSNIQLKKCFESKNIKITQLNKKSNKEKAQVNNEAYIDNTVYFLDNFIPKNTIEYRNEDIDILEPVIKTKNGTPVNVLVFGKRYRYEVKFVSKTNKSFKNVAFGIDFHTEKGLKMASIESVLSYKKGIYKKIFEPHEEFLLSFEFDCLLPAGDYFINNGISSFAEGNQYVLNRKIDILCFRVLDVKSRIYDGCNYIFKKIKLNDYELWNEKQNLKV